jgi:hypothetical protein
MGGDRRDGVGWWLAQRSNANGIGADRADSMPAEYFSIPPYKAVLAFE